jgi:Tol biopolymer transport system component/predicted Ser/Thr protein kinase
MTGQKVGHYQVLEKLGEGGMGVVYKARDTHLDRFVALKVLPAEKVSDPERRRRFVQEAKAASALNHSNIITIYDIDQAEGIHFISMECVAGKTLADLIGRKGLKLNETLKYAVQIADALAAAHAAGIVHRDLKPANVMVTEKGAVKVLDFGLAKLTEPAPADEFAPTQTLKPHTEEGVILGTVAYMSPEQAQGRAVDARSDIFSFGSMLYEMVTGRRAFHGETKLSTLSAILHKEPKPAGEIVEGVPPELDKIVTRCLRKDPDRRIQHLDDVKLALEELKEESDSGKVGQAFQPVLVRRKHLRHWIGLAVVAMLLAAAAGVTWWLTRSPKAAPAPVLTRLTSDSGLTTDPALSPDGKLLAYASDRSGEGNLDIWVQQVGGGEPMRLTRDPADEHEPAFSPDGTKIAFRSEREGGAIYVVSALGGAARRVAPEGRAAQFSPDGNWIAYWTGFIGGGQLARGNSKTYVVASAGGAPKQVQPGFAAAAYPVWSPDGNRLLFLGNRDDKLPAEESIDWWVSPLEPGPATKTGFLAATRAHQLLRTFQVYPWALVSPAWAPDGHSVIFSARAGDSTNLWRLPISPKTWNVLGPAERLTFGTTLEQQPAVTAGPAGLRVAFASLIENIDIWSLPIDANQGKLTGDLQRLTQDAAADIQPALSADGQRMVFLSGPADNQEVWIKDLGSGEQHALTFTRSNKYYPLFSPDGSKLSYGSQANGKWNICVVPAAGGAVETVCQQCGIVYTWTSDGKRGVSEYYGGRIGLVELSSGRTTELLAHPNYRLYQPHFSPDNRWIAFIAVTAGCSHVYVAPFRTEALIGESDWIAVTDVESWHDKPRWSPDGNLLYHTSDRDGFRCVWAQRLHPATKQPVGAPFAVYHSHSARRSLINMDVGMLAISVAGGRLVFNMAERTGNIWMAEWKER